MRVCGTVAITVMSTALGTLAGAASAAETPAGTWLTEEKASKIRIGTCGKAFCATIVWAKGGGVDQHNPDPGLRTRPIVGLQLSKDIRRDEKGGWNASMYNPQNGKTYRTTLTPKGRALEIGGCILGGLLCGSETWERAADTTASIGTH